MTTRFIPALCLALAACNPKAVVVEPIAPAVVEAKGKVQAVQSATTRTQQGAAETAKRVGAVGDGIDEAMVHADYVRTSKAPGTPESSEWERQWELLTDIRTRHLFAVESADSTLSQSKEAQTLADSASKGMEKLEDHAKQTDNNTTRITTENAKLAPAAAAWNGLKKFGKTLIVIGVLAVLIIGGLKLYFR